MRLFNKVAIIGVGLIGGSIGLAIKKRGIANEVIGVFRHEKTLKRALRHKAIDRGTLDIKKGVEGADLVIVATPVYSIPDIVKKVLRCAKKGAIITDVGSTKKWCVEKIDKMLGSFKGISFVGSHPMAGSEHAGVEFARADLLYGSPCIVTPTRRTDKKAMKKIERFWQSLGGRVEVMDPVSHDRRISLVSHLPHLIAFTLAGTVPESMFKFAAEGFKDTTRIASSDPRMWSDIFLSNRAEVIRSAKMFEKFYRAMIKKLSANKYRDLYNLLDKIRTKRDKYIYGK